MQHRPFTHAHRRASAIAVDVPLWPFTRADFRSHLASRPLAAQVDTDTLLDELVDSGSVLKLGRNIDLWVGVDDLDAIIETLESIASRECERGGSSVHRNVRH